VTYLRRNWISLLTIATFAVAWQVASYLAPKTVLMQTPLVPSWQEIFGPSLLGMADYWKFDFWAPITSMGGEQTLRGALLALVYHSALTWSRLMAGLLLGAFVGVGLGLIISASRVARDLTYLPLAVLRMVPLLAMIPLFQFWVGTTTWGVILFVAYGTGVIYLTGTVNACANIKPHFIDYARTLGLTPMQIRSNVVVPAILPELASSIMLTLGLAWSAVLAAEYVGIETGLGRILTFAQFMSQTGRMALVTFLLIVYASFSYWVFRRIARRVLSWMHGEPV
jgi:sulfonate transport system permease protein